MVVRGRSFFWGGETRCDASVFFFCVCVSFLWGGRGEKLGETTQSAPDSMKEGRDLDDAKCKTVSVKTWKPSGEW